MSGYEGFSGGNRGFNVLDCGAHRSDNLTPYAPPAKLQPLAPSHRGASLGRREHGAGHCAAGARGSNGRNGVQRLLLEPSDALIRAESACIGSLRCQEDSRCRDRRRAKTDRRPRNSASPRSHLQRHRARERRCASARDLFPDQPHSSDWLETARCFGRAGFAIRAGGRAERAALLRDSGRGRAGSARKQAGRERPMAG